MDKIPADAPAPRLCHLVKWPDFDGFGFNLHGEKTKPGQYIGKVDQDSPADAAGLKAKDRIIEVNGTNIANENHKQVVQRIKAFPNETKLLVLDDKGEEYYKSRNIIVTGDMPNVIIMKTPERSSSPSEVTLEEKAGSGSGGPELHPSHHSDEEGGSHISDTGSYDSSSLPSKNNSLKESRNGHYAEDDRGSPMPSTATPSPTPLTMTLSMSNSSTKGSNSSLDLNMTAQQMRAKLADRKKVDPKNSKMDLKKKYEIIQSL